MVRSKAAGARFRDAARAELEPTDRDRVAFLTPEELPDYILGHAPSPESGESLVKGYRVKVRQITPRRRR